MSVVAPPRPPVQPPQPQPDPDALIKEARDRQRRRRRRIAFAFVVAVAGAAVGYGIDHGGGSHPSAGRKPGSGSPSSSTPRQRQDQLARAAAKVTVGDAALIAPGVGWAINGVALWLTTNDGQDWWRITPPWLQGQDVIARVGDVDFIDAEHGLVSAELNGNISVNGSLRYGGISITSDGGMSWRLVTLPGCRQCANTNLSFLDARHGYALVAGESTHATPIKRLYSTSDGGSHWSLVRPMSLFGRLLFTDELHGWEIDDPSSWKQSPCCAIPVGEGIVHRTVDGGRTWQRVSLPVPAAYRGERLIATWMRFFDDRHGVIASLVLDRTTKRLRVIVDATADGGASWTARAAPTSSEQPQSSEGLPYASFSASSTADWMLFSRTRPLLFRTADGGRSWSAISISPHPKPMFVWASDFATSSQGWAVFPVGDSGAALVRTTDGGRSWTPLTPPMPKLPPIPTPPPSCASSCLRP